MAKSAPAKPDTATAGAQRPPVQCDVEPTIWERCRKDLHLKLARAITNGHETGDVGRISGIVADIRAMDLIEPTRRPPPPEPERVLTPEDRRLEDERREQREAASDPVKMRAYNAKIANKEAMSAAREDAGQ